MGKAKTYFWGSLLVTTAYATLRYNVFGTVSWTDLPLFVLNKSIAWTSIILLALSYLWRDKSDARTAGCLGVALASTHILISLVLLSCDYFPRLVNGGKLPFTGQLSLLAGVGAIVSLSLPALGSLQAVRESLGEVRWRRWQRIGYAALALSALHTLAYGLDGWLRPHMWPGGLPPITLLSTVIALIPGFRRIARRDGANAATRHRVVILEVPSSGRGSAAPGA